MVASGIEVGNSRVLGSGNSWPFSSEPGHGVSNTSFVSQVPYTSPLFHAVLACCWGLRTGCVSWTLSNHMGHSKVIRLAN